MIVVLALNSGYWDISLQIEYIVRTFGFPSRRNLSPNIDLSIRKVELLQHLCQLVPPGCYKSRGYKFGADVLFGQGFKVH